MNCYDLDIYISFRYRATRNLMSHRSSYFLLNVLEEYCSLSKFRSTLGHKVNHSFTKANAIFISVIHPRHGPIKAAISTRKIMRGQEILCNYDYDSNAYVPRWYAELYKEETNKDWPTKLIFDELDNVNPIYRSFENS